MRASSYTAALTGPEILESKDLSLRLRFRVRNLGQREWPASSVRMGYLILDPATGTLIEDGGRADFAQTLQPRDETQMEMLVSFPEENGRYRVLISPLEEDVAWFYRHGSNALFVDAEVINGLTHVIPLERRPPSSRAREGSMRHGRRAGVQPFHVIWPHL